MLSLEILSGEYGEDSSKKIRYKFGIYRGPKQSIDDAI
jgi:hypothetical protein